MTARRRVAAALLLVGLAGCASRGDDEPARRITELPQPGPALSQELMLGLALARNYHHKADVYLKEARFKDAVASVRQILGIQFPAGSAEGEDVLLDARARLAKLLVKDGDLVQALAVVDEGIGRVKRQSFFLANLHTVRGEVLEARAAQVEEQDQAAAKAARHQAIESYDRAIAIEKGLIQQLAGGEGE
jgi:hypothetical protein